MVNRRNKRKKETKNKKNQDWTMGVSKVKYIVFFVYSCIYCCFFFFLFQERHTSIIIYSTYGNQTVSELRRGMPFIKTSKSLYLSPTSALHWATWCIACLIRLVQANPTVTNCALLFTLITPLEEVGLYWARLSFTSGSQRSQLSRVETSRSNTHLHPHPSSPHHPPFTQQLNLDSLYLLLPVKD